MLLSPSPSPTLQPSRLDPFVISFVGSICIIFLLVSYYKVLRQHCCSSPAVNFSRNRNQRQRLNENNLDEPSLQFPSQGLNSYIMRTLPTMQFKKDREESKQKDTDCAVCLGEFEDGEWLKNLPNCSHVFHVACIDTWFQTHSSCPLCRSGVFDLEYSVPIYNLNETSSREELTEERAAFYHVLRSHILRTTNFS